MKLYELILYFLKDPVELCYLRYECTLHQQRAVAGSFVQIVTEKCTHDVDACVRLGKLQAF